MRASAGLAPIALAKLRYALGSAVLPSETLESSLRLPIARRALRVNTLFRETLVATIGPFFPLVLHMMDDGTRFRGRLNSKPRKTTCSDRLILPEEILTKKVTTTVNPENRRGFLRVNPNFFIFLSFFIIFSFSFIFFHFFHFFIFFIFSFFHFLTFLSFSTIFFHILFLFVEGSNSDFLWALISLRFLLTLLI